MDEVMNCATENCERLPERNGYCATCNRSRRKAAAPKAKPARKRIAKQSEEGKERMAVYLAIRELYLQAHPFCEVTGPPHRSTDIHHRKSRLGDLLFDVRYFLAVSREAHQYIETHPQEAYERGWSLSRHQTETI